MSVVTVNACPGPHPCLYLGPVVFLYLPLHLAHGAGVGWADALSFVLIFDIS